SPAIAWRLSTSEEEDKHELTEDQTLFLNKSARKTWAFFEQFVNEEDNWLPPDNFQEHPEPVIAHRTSPTNIGLVLLSNLTAYDFGYIPIGEMVQRCNNTLQTLQRMDRYKGHFYNWYDTQTLLSLNPRYVSTVDSGNLLGHLLTLRQGLLSLQYNPLFHSHSFEGLRTTVEIIQDLLKGQKNIMLEKIQGLLTTEINEKSNSLSTIKTNLDNLLHYSNELLLWEEDNENDLTKWTTKLQNQIKSIRTDLSNQIPWLDLLPVPDQFIH